MKKTLNFSFVLFFAGILFFSSCIKKENGSEPPTKKPEKVTELKVPDGFDWKTSRNVVCDFTSLTPLSIVNLSLENGAEPFASFYVGEGTDKVVVNIPTYIDDIFVSYNKEDRKSSTVKVAVKENTLSYVVPADGKDYTNVVTPISASLTKGVTRANDLPVIGYPSSGWGTVMFEDNWPNYGDYDFNDMVVGYKIQLYPNNKNMVKEMVIGVTVRAEGGLFPYELYLRMFGVKGGEVSEITILSSENGPANLDVIAMNNDNNIKDPAIIQFLNCKNSNKPSGSPFFNTEKGYTTSDVFIINFHVELRNSVKQADLGEDSFEFFMAMSENSHQKEIHMKGHRPAFDIDFNEAIQKNGNKTGQCLDDYLSNENLVWVLKVDAAVGHPYEKIDIINAYPDFVKWVESGGALSKDWYKNKVNDNIIGW